MPEGPEIRRQRDQLAAVLEGRSVIAQFYWSPLQAWNGRLDGIIKSVRSRGKALLIAWSDHILYSHNQLYGRWLIAPLAQTINSKRQLRLSLQTEQHQANLYSASTIEILKPEQIDQHPFLSQLGPDVLEASPAEIQAQLERYPKQQLGHLLLKQSVLAGIGNYLRCEILFYAGIHPRKRWSDLRKEQQQLLIEAIHHLPQQSYQSGGITYDLATAQKLIAEGASLEEARFWVFRRAGQACYRCQNLIIRQKNCYLCPSCQAE